MPTKSNAHNLVSVIIPFFNGRKFIKDAIVSVINQTHPNVEIIVVNDGSPDTCRDIFDCFNDHITIINQSNQGVARARNNGIRNSSGYYIAFLDQDDLWKPRKIEEQINAIRSHSGAGLTHTDWESINFDTGEVLATRNMDIAPHLISGQCYERLLMRNDIRNSSVLVTREAIESVGLCNENIKGNTVADYDLWLRIAKNFEISFVNQPLTTLRCHAEQGSLKHTEMIEATLNVLLSTEIDDWASCSNRRNRLAELYDQSGSWHFENAEFVKAKTAFKNSLILSPRAKILLKFIITLLPNQLLNKLNMIRRNQ